MGDAVPVRRRVVGSGVGKEEAVWSDDKSCITTRIVQPQVWRARKRAEFRVCVCVCVCAGAVPAGGVTHRAALQKGGRIHRGTHTHFYTHTHTHTHSPTHSLSDIFSKRRRQSHAHGRAHRQTTVSVGVDQGATKARGALVHSHTVAHSGGLSKAPREWTKARGGSTGSKTLARVVSRPCEDGSV